MRAEISAIPDGEYYFEDSISNATDPPEADWFRLLVVIDGDSLIADFTGSDPQGPHVMNCTYGVAAIREIMERDLAANAAAVGGRMKRKLVALADKHEVVRQVTGEGLLLGIEYVRDGATHEPFPEEVAFAKQVDAACRERGLITRPSAHVQIIAPPLIPTDEQADEIVGTVDAAIGEVAARLAPRKSGTARKKPSAALTAGPGD